MIHKNNSQVVMSNRAGTATRYLSHLIFLTLIGLLVPIIGAAQNDVGISAISSPQTGCQLGAETVQADVFNYGASIGLATFDVTYVVNGTSTFTQNQVFTSFNTNETRTITFTLPADLSNPGVYQIDVFTELASDVNNLNDTMTIMVENFPATNGGMVMSDDTVCEGSGDTLWLTGHTGQVQGWEYSTDNGASWISLTNTDTFLVYSNLMQTTQYRAEVKSGTCTAEYSSIATITVDSAPDAGTLAASATVCASGNGDVLQLSNYSGNIEGWQQNDGNGWINISNTTDTLAYNNLTQTTAYRTIVGNGVCDADTSNVVTITVVSGSVGGQVQGSDTVCQGINSGTLQLTNYAGNIIRWERSTDNGANWVPVVNTTDQQTYQNVNNTTFYRVLVEASGCSAVYSDTAVISVEPAPEGGMVAESKSICGGGGADTLYLQGYTGNIVKWQFDNGSGWMDIANTSDTLIVNNISTTTSYHAIVGNGVCANDTSDAATITIIATTVGGTIAQSDSVCFGDNAGTLMLSGFVGDIHWWEQSSDMGVTWTPIANLSTIQGYSDLEESTWYRVLVKGDNCPDAYSDTAEITTYTPEVQITANGPVSFCEGDSVILFADTGFNSYLWTNGSTADTSVANTDGFHRVVVTDQNGCTGQDSILITVYNLPQAQAGEDQTISLGETTTLNGSGGTSYQWTPIETLDDPNVAAPMASPLETTNYVLEVTDENGCMNSDSVLITVVKDFMFDPNNTITPNGDGFNDTWVIDNIHAYPEANVLIMDRFGTVVHEQDGYDNTWDGTSQGQQLPDGTYYYVITAPGTEMIYKGHLTIITR